MKMTKRFYKSTTFWSGLATIATGIYLIVTGNIPEGILTIGTGLGAIAGRSRATKPLS